MPVRRRNVDGDYARPAFEIDTARRALRTEFVAQRVADLPGERIHCGAMFDDIRCVETQSIAYPGSIERRIERDDEHVRLSQPIARMGRLRGNDRNVRAAHERGTIARSAFRRRRVESLENGILARDQHLDLAVEGF